MENNLEEYAVKCVKVQIANEIFWIPATSEADAINTVKEYLSLGHENYLEHRVETVVEPTWFNYTATKNGFLKDEATNDRK